ncbi:hypothetical protein [[Phormidium] sp. ETS-05]|nr:hypothetical protein [[Phormidium] sp. ETS-05]
MIAKAARAIDVASPEKKVLDKEEEKKGTGAKKSEKLLMSVGVK